MKATRSSLPGLLSGFLLVCGGAASSFGQTPREFTNPTDGLRYQVVNRDTVPVIDKSGTFPGGNEALIKYLQKGLTLPPGLQRKGVEGMVKARLLIGTSGEIAEVRITESLHPQLDSMVTGLIRKMPAWSPSFQGNHPIRTVYQLPVRFTHLTESGRAKVRTFETGGVGFKHFKNWEASNYPTDKGTEVKITRKGFGKSGTVFISWQNDTVSLAERMQAELDWLTGKAPGVMQFTFGKPTVSGYNKHKALRTTGFVALTNLMGALAGRMALEVYTFNTGDRSFLVKIMEYEEDTKKIGLDLGVIEGGFSYPAAN